MTNCAACGTTIVFGGVRDADRRFCSEKCRSAGASADIAQAAASIPESVVMSRAWEVHLGPCPVCHGSGPVDVHLSYRVWSAIHITQRSTRQNLCCRRCATRARLKDTLFSLAFGWWGIPWGFIFTP